MLWARLSQEHNKEERSTQYPLKLIKSFIKDNPTEAN